jgi:hypothetical membrane protein
MTTVTDVEINTRNELTTGLYRAVSLGAALGPLLFTSAWIVLGVLQPAVRTEYGLIGGIRGAITNPISALGVGPHAREFNLAFILCGLLMACGAFAVRERISSIGNTTIPRSFAILLSLSPLGLILAGLFTLQNSLAMHNVAAILVFVAPVVTFPLCAAQIRRIPGQRGVSNALFLAGPLTLAFLVLFLVTFQLPAIIAGTGIAGLTERLLLAEIHIWYIALGWRAFRAHYPASPKEDRRHP